MNSFMKVSFGDMVSGSRKLKGWTIKEFIEKLEAIGQKSVSPTYVTRIEQYGEIPSPEFILIIADILKLDKKKLLECAKQTKLQKLDKSLDEKYSKALMGYPMNKRKRGKL